MRAKDTARLAWVERACAECGKTFRRYHQRDKDYEAKYCSRECYHKPRKSLAERFWERVQKAEGDACWLWTGQWSRHTGYGMLGKRRENDTRWHPVSAHRISWELNNGPIPDGLWVLHTCDNKRCVRPDHLFLGTQQDNVDDMWAKGRGATGERHGSHIHPERWRKGPRPHLIRLGETNVNAKLTADKVRRMRERHSHGETIALLAREYGVSETTANQAIRRKTWQHVA